MSLNFGDISDDAERALDRRAQRVREDVALFNESRECYDRERQEVCWYCKGTGHKVWYSGHIEKCLHCYGHGMIQR